MAKKMPGGNSIFSCDCPDIVNRSSEECLDHDTEQSFYSSQKLAKIANFFSRLGS